MVNITHINMLNLILFFLMFVSICQDAFHIDINNKGQTLSHSHVSSYMNEINNNLIASNYQYIPSDHLIVVSHGIMGNHKDLSYLSSKLQSTGCIVLQSKSNEFLKSFSGIKQGGISLVEEINLMRRNYPNLKRISFIGNSLGGMYTRYAIKLLYDRNTQLMNGLIPYYFMTIATPHLGVWDFNYVEELLNIHLPSILKVFIAELMYSTGKELFLLDSSSSGSSKDNMKDNTALLCEMATKDEYLIPLQVFKKRRCYANLNLDFVVPLGTAAFLSKDYVLTLRKKYNNNTIKKHEIIELFYNNISSSTSKEIITSSNSSNSKKQEDVLDAMRDGLNSMLWEKVLVKFKGTIPIAHNKIAAITKYNQLIDSILGFPEGRFVMDHATAWITTD